MTPLPPSDDHTLYGSLPIAHQKNRPWVSKHRVPLALASIAVMGLITIAPKPSSHMPISLASAKIKLTVIETSLSTGRMAQPILNHAPFDLKFATPPRSSISIDESIELQEILGFGGAFTEAAALQLRRLPREKQGQVLQMYFDPTEGAAYSFGRVPMNSCDFSPSTYAFANVENDIELQHFDMDVTHDQEAIIPFIRRALSLRSDLKLFLSPWSPPAWMKYPDSSGRRDMLGSAQPYGLQSDFRSTWALYFSKFINAYKRHGISFWGLTPQNEPQQPAPWEACLYDDAYQAEFVAEYLGPLIRREHPELKILIFDHNRGNVHLWSNAVFNHSAIAPFIDGVAFHWYDNSRDLDGVQNHEHVNQTHTAHPSAFLLATESANCPGVATGTEAWNRGLRYAHDILADISNWSAGWVDWNLLLDHTGGPNKLGNTCDAPIIVNEDASDYIVQPMYYFIKQFSAYVPPGSKRIRSRVNVQYKYPGSDTRLSPRFPGGAYGCDGSSRQLFERTEDSKLQLKNSKYCLDVVPEPWLGNRIEMVECQYTSNKWTFQEDSSISFNGECLTHSNGATEDGSRLTIEECTGFEDQKWTFQENSLRNEISQHCVTAGYAFTQAIAFKTPQEKIVLIVLNENTEEAAFQIETNDHQVDTVVPPLSIRTYMWS